MEWLKDNQGNQCSVEYFGSREKAQAALDSLKNCAECINCSDCSECSCCSGCSYCSHCSECSDCSECSRCSDCSYCSHCSGCSGLEAVEDKKEEKALEIRNTIPVVANLHQRIYEAASAPGALEMGTWHTCDKTHCRAGWTVTLAGEAGRKLESFFNTELAAMMIYDASCPGFKINPARFFDDNDVALADMKKLAEGV